MGVGSPDIHASSPCWRGASQCDSRFLSDTEADPSESSLGGGLRFLGLPSTPDALTWRADPPPRHFFSACFTPASSRSASRQPCKAGTGGPSTAEGGEARGGCRLANGTLLPRAFEFKLPFYQGSRPGVEEEGSGAGPRSHKAKGKTSVGLSTMSSPGLAWQGGVRSCRGRALCVSKSRWFS